MTSNSHVRDIIATRNVSPLFQPIVSVTDQQIYGYEALIRGPSDSPLHSPIQLFQAAQRAGLLASMERICRRVCIQKFLELGLPGKLFLNVSPESLLQSDHRHGETLALLKELEMIPESVVIELTEHHPTEDLNLMQQATCHYRAMGLAIAIDDLGAGYSGLRLWSELRPEFVKIDRHFISGINDDTVKREFVKSIIEISRAIDCLLIAEGIETREEAMCLRDMGITLMQGYYIARPSAEPFTKMPSALFDQPKTAKQVRHNEVTVTNLLLRHPPVSPDVPVNQVANMFREQPSIFSIVVVSEQKPVGIVYRHRLMELLLQPYGKELYSTRPVSRIMATDFLAVESHLPLEQVSRLVTSRARLRLEEDFIIVHLGHYQGIGQVIDLLKQITELQVRSARHANPLTMLPGNVPINECIERLLEEQDHFVACYFDLDNFKPFNDVYGYSKGDEVLLFTATLLRQSVNPSCDFVGHIGGDDFIIVFRSANWRARVDCVFEFFNQKISDWYSQEHQDAGGIYAKDRHGEFTFFSFLSMSVGVIDSSALSTESAQDVASQVTEAKRGAKKIQGNSIFIHNATGIEIQPISINDWDTSANSSDVSAYLQKTADKYLLPEPYAQAK